MSCLCIIDGVCQVASCCAFNFVVCGVCSDAKLESDLSIPLNWGEVFAVIHRIMRGGVLDIPSSGKPVSYFDSPSLGVAFPEVVVTGLS